MLKAVEIRDSRDKSGIIVSLSYNFDNYDIRIIDDDKREILFARVETEDLIQALFETALDSDETNRITIKIVSFSLVISTSFMEFVCIE